LTDVIEADSLEENQLAQQRDQLLTDVIEADLLEENRLAHRRDRFE